MRDQLAIPTPASSNISPVLARNRAFAAAASHKDAVVFPNLRLFVITCLDPRVDPTHFLGLELSDAIVVRNVGGRVTQEVINDVAFIAQIAENVLPEGPLFEVAVIQHTQCGAGALADGTFRRIYGLSRHRCGQCHPIPSACSSCGRWRVIGPQVSRTRASAALAEWKP